MEVIMKTKIYISPHQIWRASNIDRVNQKLTSLSYLYKQKNDPCEQNQKY